MILGLPIVFYILGMEIQMLQNLSDAILLHRLHGDGITIRYKTDDIPSGGGNGKDFIEHHKYFL